MKTISSAHLEQVSGGYSQCLMSIYDAVSNSTHCLIQVSGDMPTFNIPMEYAIPLAIIAVGVTMAYDMYKESNKTICLPPVMTPPYYPQPIIW